MPRQKKIWYPGATYHVIVQGVRDSPLFLQSTDFLKFYSILDDAALNTPFLLLAYCLTPKHVQLLIQTRNSHISKVMHSINTPYARWFNKKYDLNGSVFEQPYRWFPIQTEKELIFTSAYVHNSPRLINEEEQAMDYPWTSYHFYSKPDVLTKGNKLSLINSMISEENPVFYFQQSPEEILKFSAKKFMFPPPKVFCQNRIISLFPWPIYEFYREFVDRIWAEQEKKIKLFQ